MASPRGACTLMAPPAQLARPLAQQMLSAVRVRADGSTPGADELRRVAARVGRRMLAERDVATAKHSDDVVVISEAMCEVLEIRGAERQDLLTAARLHDIGKAAITREILDKPGKLTDEDWGEIRAHTAIGAEIIGAVPNLDGVAAMIRSSHERWDGGGYPDGLAAEEIPRGSRVIFCADAFHAMRSDRPYRRGRSAADALAEVKRNSGSQFDPEIVAALVEVARRLKLAPATSGFRSSARLMALLLALAVGVGGTALAKSGLLDAGNADGASQGGAAACSSECVAPFGAPSAATFRAWVTNVAGGGHAQSPKTAGKSRSPTDARTSGAPAGGSNGAVGSNRDGPGSGHPLGGPPGQTGNHPLGGPPGQTGNHPQGGRPGQGEKD